jgi:predicted ATPase
MSESLKVHEFLAIKKSLIEIKKINIIIGRQASGKSVIAKLVYFFRRSSKYFLDGIRSQSSKRELDKTILEDFEMRFPRYAWDGSSFEILYEVDQIQMVIAGKSAANGKTRLSVSYSENLARLFTAKKRVYSKALEEYSAHERPSRKLLNYQNHLMYECVVEPLRQNEEYGRFFASSVFIPASRSFFANLQKNIFTFMASNLDIDPFLKDFGSLYESSKRWYRDSLFPRKPEDLAETLDRSIESIIDGRYVYDDDQDWIQSKGRRVNLVNASSGQQEALPMLLTLAVWPFITGDGKDRMFFIEEPEAHLFPTSQSRIISMLTALRANLDMGFFVTTHSPYILSALNNNILAGDVKKEKKITDAEFRKIGGDGSPIDFEDVSAYTMASGQTKRITDAEFRMIGGEVLDEVSDHFQVVMNELLERMGADN